MIRTNPVRLLRAVGAACCLSFMLTLPVYASLPEPGPFESPIPADAYQMSGFSSSGVGGWNTASERVTADDIDRLVLLLGLSDDQAQLAREMAVEMERGFRELQIERRETQADMNALQRTGQDWGEIQRRQAERGAEFRDRAQQIEDTCYTELRLVLTAEQDALWDAVERDRLRDKHLRRGALVDGERYDPVALADSLDLDEAARARVAPVLHAYLEELEPLLTARVRTAERLSERAQHINQQQQSLWSNPNSEQDWEARQARLDELEAEKRSLGSTFAELHGQCLRIAELNRRTYPDLEAALSPEHAGALTEAVESVGTRGRGDGADARRFGRMDMGGSLYSRAAMIFERLPLEDAQNNEESEDDGFRMPEEMRSGLNDEQLVLVEQIEGLVQQLYETGFDEGMGMPSGPVEGLTDAQKESLLAIKERFDRDYQRLESEMRRVTGADEVNEPELPPYASVTTDMGTLSLMHTASENSMHAVHRMHGPEGQEQYEKMQDVQRRMTEIDQRVIDQVRALLTLDQREALAGI